ncbi:MAG: cytochrome P460 family protein [Planctomycetota bacterium]
MIKKTSIVTTCLIASALLSSCGGGGSTEPKGLTHYLAQDGAPRLPADFRNDEWVHLGTWSVAPAEGQKVHQQHNTYAERSAVEAYQKTGTWPDGSTLVKELVDVTPETMNTGFVAGGGKISGYFVMVKSAKTPIKDTPHWGDGWYGSQFGATDRTKNVSTGWNSCRACHDPVKSTDWVFVDGYPMLER